MRHIFLCSSLLPTSHASSSQQSPVTSRQPSTRERTKLLRTPNTVSTVDIRTQGGNLEVIDLPATFTATYAYHPPTPFWRSGHHSPGIFVCTALTCVKICHDTMTILRDCRGMNRAKRSTSPRCLPGRSPDVTYDATATAAKTITTRTKAARTKPLALPRHLVQVKPSWGAYPSLQIAQSAKTAIIAKSKKSGIRKCLGRTVKVAMHRFFGSHNLQFENKRMNQVLHPNATQQAQKPKSHPVTLSRATVLYAQVSSLWRSLKRLPAVVERRTPNDWGGHDRPTPNITPRRNTEPVLTGKASIESQDAVIIWPNQRLTCKHVASHSHGPS